MVSTRSREYSWLPGSAAVALIAVFIWLGVLEWQGQERDWQSHLALERQRHLQTLQVQEQRLTRQAEVLAQIIAAEPQIRAAVRATYQAFSSDNDAGEQASSQRARAELKTLLSGDWLRLENLGANQLSLYFAPGAVNFLRMNRSERFGDSVLHTRPLIAQVFASGLPAEGLDINREGSAYSAVVPITERDSGGRVIAVLEVALRSLPSDMAEDLRQAVFLRKSSLDSLLWQQSIQTMNQLSQTTVDVWRLERTSSPQLLEWWSRGQLPIGHSASLLRGRDQREYLVSWWPFSRAATTPENPDIAMAVWTDETDDHLALLKNRDQGLRAYAGLCLFAELLLLLFWRLNRARVHYLMEIHEASLKREIANSELVRERLALALRSSESGFWLWNIAEDRAEFSSEWRELCGLPEAAERGQDLDDWMSRVHPADKRASYADLVRHIKGETAMYENEYRLRVADGSYKWILSRGKVVEWLPDGRAALMLGVYSDVTQRKQMELTSVRQQAALHALNEIASLPSVNPDEQLRQALGLAARYLNLSQGAVCETRMGRCLIRVQYSLRDSESLPSTQPLSQSFASLVLAAREVVAEDNIPHSSIAQHPACAHSKNETFIGVPLWIHGDIYGTLEFFGRKSRQHEYDRLDRDFVRLLARWIGSVVERWQQDQDKKAIIERFNKLSERVPGFLYQYQLRPDGSSFFPYASPGINSIYHLSPEDVQEDAGKLFAVLHPDDLGWVSETVSYSATHLTPWVGTVRVNHPERGLIWTHAQAIPERLPDGSILWNGYVADITTIKRTELELEQINALNKAMFDAASVSIISTDVKGTIKTFNRGAEWMLGYQAEELINVSTPAPLHLPEEIERRARELERELGYPVPLGFDVFIAKAREGEDDENEWTYVRKDGSTFPVLLTVSALRDQDGEIFGYMGIGRDISELKRIDQMKSEFISTVSHELRTPLTAVNGALGILDSGGAGGLNPTAARMINIATNNAQRLIYLVNDLLDMEKLVAGKMHFDIQRQALLPIVRQSIEANAAYAQTYKVEYQLTEASDDAQVEVDALRLQQVLANYLSNAAKFSPQGSSVRVHIERRFSSVRVSVIDKGPGIPDEFRSRIFQKFSQADSSDTRIKGGTGLGLAICKQIIERMGGKIGFDSTYGEGAEFYFDLSCEDNTQKIPSSTLEPEAPSYRLLVVEDDESISNLWQALLTRAGYTVDAVATGASALEHLALRSYHLLILDLDLPDLSGLDLLRQVRESESPFDRDDSVPIMVISGAMEAGRSECPPELAKRALYWYQKPLKTGEFLAAVEGILALQTDGSGASAAAEGVISQASDKPSNESTSSSQ